MDEVDLIKILCELNEVSSQIIDLYDKVLIEMLDNKNIECHTIELKQLIAKEEDIIEKIPKEELVNCLDILDETLGEDKEFSIDDDCDNYALEEEYYEQEDDYEDSLVDLSNDFNNDNELAIERMNNKIMQAKEIADNKFIAIDSLDVFKDNTLRNSLSIYDVIGALILIETIQVLNYKIKYSLPFSKELSANHYENDLKFLKELDKELLEYKVKTMRTYSTIEILILGNNISIEQISKDNIETIKMVTSNEYEFEYENIIEICIKEVINKLAEMNSIKNTSNGVFEYMELTTKLDILLFNTDKDLVLNLEKYYEEMNFKNNGIKKRVKNIFEEHRGKGRSKRLNNN